MSQRSTPKSSDKFAMSSQKLARPMSSESKMNYQNPNVIKYTQGVADASYREVVHVSPKKLEKIKKLLQDENQNGAYLNIEVCKYIYIQLIDCKWKKERRIGENTS